LRLCASVFEGYWAESAILPRLHYPDGTQMDVSTL